MAPKRGKKRKQTRLSAETVDGANDETPLSPPDRETWPGWVEMESEPVSYVMCTERARRLDC